MIPRDSTFDARKLQKRVLSNLRFLYVLCCEKSRTRIRVDLAEIYRWVLRFPDEIEKMLAVCRYGQQVILRTSI